MEITPSDATLGAEVRGVDLSQSLSAADFAEIEAAWHDHAVLIFPDQGLSDEAHLDFTRRFGRLEQGIRRSNRNGRCPNQIQRYWVTGHSYRDRLQSGGNIGRHKRTFVENHG